MKKISFLIALWVRTPLFSQYWQQAVDYTIAVELDAATAQYVGTEKNRIHQ